MKEQYFIILGNGKHQKPLIAAAKERNYTVIILENEKKQQEDAKNLYIFYRILEKKEILERILLFLKKNNIREEQIQGITTRSYGSIYEIINFLATYFELPRISKQANLELFQNKILLKERLTKKTDISLPSRYTLDELHKHLEKEQGKCFILRPNNGFAKQDIALVYDIFDLKRKEEKIGRENLKNYLLEEYIEHIKELTVMGIVQNGNYIHLCIIQKKTNGIEKPFFVELQHSYPSFIDKEIEQEILRAMQKLVSATALENTPIVAEFLYCDNTKKVYLVECMPETGGEQLAEIIVPQIIEDDYFALIISLLSKNSNEIDISCKENTPLILIHCVLSKKHKDTRPCYVKKIAYTDQFLKEVSSLQEFHNIPFYPQSVQGNHQRLLSFVIQKACKDNSSHKEQQKVMKALKEKSLILEKTIKISYEKY